MSKQHVSFCSVSLTAPPRPAVARSVFGPAGYSPLGPETNLGLPRRPLLVGSLAPALHLRTATAQSQERRASKHFGLPQGLVKIRGRQPERRLILPREAGARFRQLTLETGPRQPRRQPRRARQTPMPFAANAAVEA